MLGATNSMCTGNGASVCLGEMWDQKLATLPWVWRVHLPVPVRA